MSEEREIAEVEKELWQRVTQDEGSIRANAYVALSRIAFDQGKFKESLAMCETARDIFDKEDTGEYQREVFEVHVGISKINYELGRTSEAAQAMGKAIEAARTFDYEEIDDLLRDQGRQYYTAGEYENSIACHLEAMEFTQLHLRKDCNGIDYFNLGLGLKELARFDEAIDAFLKSRAAFKERDEVVNAVDCDYRLAEIYVELKNPVEVMHYGQRALDFFTILNSYQKVWTLKYFLGVANQLLDDRETAGRLFEEAKSLAQAMGWQEWEFLIKVDTAFAELYELGGLHEQAQEMLRRVKVVEELARKEVSHEAA